MDNPTRKLHVAVQEINTAVERLNKVAAKEPDFDYLADVLLRTAADIQMRVAVRLSDAITERSND